MAASDFFVMQEVDILPMGHPHRAGGEPDELVAGREVHVEVDHKRVDVVVACRHQLEGHLRTHGPAP